MQIKQVEDEIVALQNQVSTLSARSVAQEEEGVAILATITEQHAKLVKCLDDNNAQLRKFEVDMKRTQEPQEH